MVHFNETFITLKKKTIQSPSTRARIRTVDNQRRNSSHFVAVSFISQSLFWLADTFLSLIIFTWLAVLKQYGREHKQNNLFPAT